MKLWELHLHKSLEDIINQKMKIARFMLINLKLFVYTFRPLFFYAFYPQS